MKKLILIKRKGFNYYTDYVETYLHRAFKDKGFYLVKDEKNSLFDVLVDVSENEKYMTLLSSYFDTLSKQEIDDFVEKLGIYFKSEVLIAECEEYRYKGVPYKIGFSDTHNAYEEDGYVYNTEPELVRESFSLCRANEPYVISCVNYGGAFKGIEITLLFDNDDVELEDVSLNYIQGKNRVSREIVFEKENNVFSCVIDDFAMDKGINRYSAKLRGKKKVNEKEKCGFYVRFIPRNIPKAQLPTMKVKALCF